jgi:hydroxymethylpyrimidine pyrophosphatase-like HAD family hydrolase
MKDLPFVMVRTPFAQAWSALGGLEMRIGKRVLKRECLEDRLMSVSSALGYARTHISATGVEIEEKHDSEGRTVAFCVDWRLAEEARIATREAEQVAAHCEALKLKLIRYETQPFYDVYPVAPDKGWALQEMLGELAVKNGVMYLGDSWMDNSAFRFSSVSVGVVHDETSLEALDCDYFVKFGDVSDFLNNVLANNLVFSSDFPMIEANRYRRKPMAIGE